MSALFPMEASGIVVRRGGVRLLGPLDLRLGAEGITVVVGPNGAGKTTLLKALHGLERPSEGRIRWPAPLDEVRRRQAFVFQTPVMLRRSVEANLAYPLELDRVPRAEIRARCADWAARLGLSGLLGRPAGRLSGGERQKLAIARALIRAPDLLFLDEPCANLDERATREIEATLIACRDAGTRIIMATHNLGQLRRLADDVVFLRDGEIHESGAAPTVLDTPRSRVFAAYLKGDLMP